MDILESVFVLKNKIQRCKASTFEKKERKKEQGKNNERH